jgi:hypothetical protein
MAEPVTVERLAAAKAIPVAVLRSFGLVDTPEGVLFKYWNNTGSPARPRLRTAMRGVDGSKWSPSSTLPIAVYSAPPDFELAAHPGDLVLVEGESDCWSAWLHGVAACGVPGPEHYDKLEHGNVAKFDAIYVLREPAPPGSKTYQAGVEVYIGNVLSRLRVIGYRGAVYELRMPDGLFDLSELHQAGPGEFLSRLAVAKAAARRIGAQGDGSGVATEQVNSPATTR